MRAKLLIVDAGLAASVALIVLILSPGLAITAIVAILVVLLCALSLLVDRVQRRVRRRRRRDYAPRMPN